MGRLHGTQEPLYHAERAAVYYHPGGCGGTLFPQKKSWRQIEFGDAYRL